MKLRLWAFFTVAIAITLAIFIYVRHVRQSPPERLDPCEVPSTAKDCDSCGGPPGKQPAGGKLADGKEHLLCCPSGYHLEEYQHVTYCYKNQQ